MSIIAQDTIVISPKTVNEIKQDIEDLKGATDCADVVGTKAELDSYDTSKLTDQAIIKVLQDESQDDAQTYYRYNKSSDSFTLIGELGPYYTKSESDAIMQDEVDARSAADQDLDDRKVDKTNNVSKVYITDASGNQATINYDTNNAPNTIVKRDENAQVLVAVTPVANSHAASKKYVNDQDALKVDKVNTANRIYGTDTNGAQTTYDKEDFGKVDDVRVNNTSIVTNKIANLTIDSALDISSNNAIQNGAVTTAINQKSGVVFRTWNNN